MCACVSGGGVTSNPLPAQATQPLPYPSDTVEFSATKEIKKPKEKMSTGAKVGIAALSIIGGLVATAVLISKHQTSKLTELYSKKMQLQTLAEHIDFKEAKTVEEGVKFAKEVLKIGEVNGNFTLDSINFANRSIVEVSNANKGKLFIPKKMNYVYDKEGNWVASVEQSIKSRDFGELNINALLFDNSYLDKKLRDLLSLDEKSTADVIKQTTTEVKNKLRYLAKFDKQTNELIKKYIDDPKSLNITEKRDLYNTLCEAGSDGLGQLDRAPLSTLLRWKNQLEEAGITVDVDAFKNLKTTEQSKKLKELLTKLQAKNGEFRFDVPFRRMDVQIYHEMGHLQDYTKNLKELDLQDWKVPNFKEFWNNSDMRPLDNRWGGLTYEGFKDLLQKNPAKFKKRYPDMYEFLTNQESQQTAGKISEYAQTSIGEFVAEVYARMVRGDKIPEDVMALYKKYNGPMLGA